METDGIICILLKLLPNKGWYYNKIFIRTIHLNDQPHRIKQFLGLFAIE